MKRTLILIPAVCMIVCTSCAGTEKPQTGTAAETLSAETDDTVRKMLSDWSCCLQANDYMYGDMLWSISYIEQFLEEPTWEHLLTARTALTTAERYISERDMPDAVMTDEDYIKMLELGYDIASVRIERDGYDSDRQVTLGTVTVLKNGLYEEIFWQDTFDAYKEYVEIEKQLYIRELEYLNMETEYYLLSVNSPGWSEKFRSFISENCAYLTSYSYSTEPFTDVDVVYVKAGEILDEIEMLDEQSLDQIGQQRAALYRMEDALSSGKTDLLRNSAVDIAGMPESVLPFPSWNMAEQAEYYYYYCDDNDEHIYPSEQEVLIEKPDGWIVRLRQVSLEELISYQTWLSSIGLDPYKVSDENDIYSLIYALGDAVFMFSYNRDHAEIFVPDGDMDFVPLWYFPE